MARTAAPSGQVQLSGLDSKLGGNLTGIPAFMQVSGSNVGIGAYFTMNSTSRLGVRVMTVNSNGTTAPAGTYRVRFNASNVGWAIPLTLTSGAQTTTCTLQPQPGYRNIQLCDLVVTTGGQMFGVDARYSGIAPELTIDSIQVFKEK